MALQEVGPHQQPPIGGNDEEETEEGGGKQALQSLTEKMDFQDEGLGAGVDGVEPGREAEGENGTESEEVVPNGSSGREIGHGQGKADEVHQDGSVLGGTLPAKVADASVASASELPTDLTLNNTLELERDERAVSQETLPPKSEVKKEEEEKGDDGGTREERTGGEGEGTRSQEKEGGGEEEVEEGGGRQEEEEDEGTGSQEEEGGAREEGGEEVQEKEGGEGDETRSQGKEEGGEKGDGEWTDILGNGQLLKKVVQPGNGPDTRPTPQCRVKVRTRGQLKDGKVVDKHSAVVFTAGDGDVIQALDLGVALMETGEVALLKAEPRFAYGAIGREPDIPGNAAITFEVELLEVVPPVDFETVGEDELIQLVNKKRLRGNDLFARKDYDLAVNSYQKGMSLLENYLQEQHLETSSEVRDMQIRIWNNMAAALTRAERYKEALEASDNVLKYEPRNVKALYRSGKALSHIGDYDLAIKRLSLATEISPDEKAILLERQKAVQKRDANREREKRMYKRMMEGPPPTDAPGARKTRPNQQDSSWGPLPYMAIAAMVAAAGIGFAYFVTQRLGH